MDQPKKIKRKKIGLLYLSTYAAWAGGIIYVQNIIRALNLLDDSERPEVAVFYGFDSPINDVKSINYPYIEYHQVSSADKFKKIFYRLKRIFTGKSAFFKVLPEVVYPYNDKIFLGKTRIDWIPDFQERYLPHMFSKEEIQRRLHDQTIISKAGGVVIFSSQDALNDFEKFYPDHNCKLRRLRFASMLPEYQHIEFSTLQTQYEIPGTYFMSPNQFWKHKNHIVLLEAIALLKNDNLDFQVVLTGSQSDPRNKEYFKTLKDFIEKNQIERWIKFLGFIDRSDQLALMYHSRAIIQPSLFEGWSTVVEDTKAMNQFIILSDIPVHREQISENCNFFDPHSSEQLATKMRESVLNIPEKVDTDYSKSIMDFSKTILSVLS
jgi:glycosyltransferase involved in cell wall biosynthesis